VGVKKSRQEKILKKRSTKKSKKKKQPKKADNGTAWEKMYKITGI